MDADALLKRTEDLLAKADALVETGTRHIHKEVDHELRTEVRTAGLTLLNDVLGDCDIQYQDFEQATRNIFVYGAMQARAILRSTLDGLREGRLPRQRDLATPTPQPNGRRVFVVHGRNEAARRSMFAFLRAVGLEPLEWSQAVALTKRGTPYVGEVLDAAFSHAKAVVVLLTGDDIAQLRTSFVGKDEPEHETQPTPQARPNVLFEAGMALGRQADRTILVALEKTRPFSDVAGRHTVNLTNDAKGRHELVSRLKTAGCDLDISSRTDWLSAGDFEGCLPPVDDDADFRRTEPDVSEREARREAAKGILERAEYAVNRLFNDPQGDSVGNLRIRVSTWEQQTVDYLDGIPFCLECHKSSFRVISPYARRGFDGKTPEHATIREEVMERVERLRLIAARIEGQGSVQA